MSQRDEPSNRPACGLSRRRWLQCLLGLGAACCVGMPAGSAAPAMLRRAIPRSKETVPAVGLGTAWAFDVGKAPDQRAGVREVLRLFVEQGGTLIDTSPMYGQAERVVGDLAADLQVADRLFYATKVWTEGEEAGSKQMRASLELLRRPKIELMQVHNLVDWRTQFKTCQAWQEGGLLRYVGITHYLSSAFDDLERLMRELPLDFVQLPYSIGAREAEQRLLPLARERGIAVIVNRPFQKADLFKQVRGKPLPPWAAEFDCRSWAQYFLKYILSHPAVTCPIPSTGKPKHLLDNMQAAHGRLPGAAERKRMVDYMRTL